MLFCWFFLSYPQVCLLSFERNAELCCVRMFPALSATSISEEFPSRLHAGHRKATFHCVCVFIHVQSANAHRCREKEKQQRASKSDISGVQSGLLSVKNTAKANLDRVCLWCERDVWILTPTRASSHCMCNKITQQKKTNKMHQSHKLLLFLESIKSAKMFTCSSVVTQIYLILILFCSRFQQHLTV